MALEAIQMGMGNAFVSGAMEAAHRLVLAYDPNLSQYLPSPKSIIRAAQWGGFFGFYLKGTTSFFPHHRVPDLYGCFVVSVGLASETLHQLTGDDYWKLMEYGKPPAAFYGSVFVAGQIARQISYLNPRVIPHLA